MEKSRILRVTSERTDIENQRAKKGKGKYSGTTLEKNTVKKKLLFFLFYEITNISTITINL